MSRLATDPDDLSMVELTDVETDQGEWAWLAADARARIAAAVAARRPSAPPEAEPLRVLAVVIPPLGAPLPSRRLAHGTRPGDAPLDLDELVFDDLDP